MDLRRGLLIRLRFRSPKMTSPHQCPPPSELHCKDATTIINPHPVLVDSTLSRSPVTMATARNLGTNKMRIWKRAWSYPELVPFLHFTASPICYYGNYFSSIGRVLLVMWHTGSSGYRVLQILFTNYLDVLLHECGVAGGRAPRRLRQMIISSCLYPVGRRPGGSQRTSGRCGEPNERSLGRAQGSLVTTA